MNTCPKCGACRTIGRMFVCGSRYIGVDDTELSRQSELCKDIAFLRERVAWLEKWREVVLGDAPTFLDDYVIEHVLGADPSDSETLRKAFDAAVRKEMK